MLIKCEVQCVCVSDNKHVKVMHLCDTICYMNLSYHIQKLLEIEPMHKYICLFFKVKLQSHFSMLFFLVFIISSVCNLQYELPTLLTLFSRE